MPAYALIEIDCEPGRPTDVAHTLGRSGGGDRQGDQRRSRRGGARAVADPRHPVALRPRARATCRANCLDSRPCRHPIRVGGESLARGGRSIPSSSVALVRRQGTPAMPPRCPTRPTVGSLERCTQTSACPSSGWRSGSRQPARRPPPAGSHTECGVHDPALRCLARCQVDWSGRSTSDRWTCRISDRAEQRICALTGIRGSSFVAGPLAHEPGTARASPPRRCNRLRCTRKLHVPHHCAARSSSATTLNRHFARSCRQSVTCRPASCDARTVLDIFRS